MIFNKKYNKEYVVLLLILTGLSGCGWKKKKTLHTQSNKKISSPNIPFGSDRNETNDESIHNFFDDQDDTIDALVSQAEQEMGKIPSKNKAVAQVITDDLGDFSLINGSVASAKESSIVYFDFDDYTINKNQEEVIRTIVAEANSKGPDGEIKLYGHACTAGGTDLYNFAIAGKRAEEVKKELVAAGIGEHRIKIIARGSEMPVIINGKAVTGDKVAQAPNRRVEYSLA